MHQASRPSRPRRAVRSSAWHAGTTSRRCWTRFNSPPAPDRHPRRQVSTPFLRCAEVLPLYFARRRSVPMGIEVFANHAHLFPAALRPEGTVDRLLKLLDACAIDRAVCFAPFPHELQTAELEPNQW